MKIENFQKLLKMVMNREVSKVIIAYPDRLTRFEFKNTSAILPELWY